MQNCLTVNKTYWSFEGPGFDSQHINDGSQPLAITIVGNSMIYSGLC